MRTSRLAILAYHSVPDEKAFEAQVRFLVRAMRPVTAEQAARAIRGVVAPPRRAVLVTFDDGDRSHLTRAAPVLARWGVPSVAFVVTGVLGSGQPVWTQEVKMLVERGARVPELSAVPLDRYVLTLKSYEDEARKRILSSLRHSIAESIPTVPQLAAEELEDLRGAGMEIGNHTHSHPCLDRCDAGTVEREIVTAHEILSDLLAGPPRLFAYPNGNWDPRAAGVLSSLGYEAGFLFDHRVARVPAQDPFAVSRLRISASASLGRLAAIASGAHASLYHVRYGR